MLLLVQLVVFLFAVSENDGARILAYYPTPSISHQVVFRPLTLELVKRGHEVVVITADPIFKNGNAPANLTEIDVHDLSYNLWREYMKNLKNKIDIDSFYGMFTMVADLCEKQILTEDVQKILQDKNQKFDLYFMEAFIEVALGLAPNYDVPIIQFSSVTMDTSGFNLFGAAVHPTLLPTPMNERVYNLSIWEKFTEISNMQKFEGLKLKLESYNNDMLKRAVGPNVRTLAELRRRVDMLFLNVNPLWDSNRPVPPNVIYLGGLHQLPPKDLPQELKEYFDSSKNGVIYVSFGTNVDPSLFPPEIIKLFVNVFSKLPYDVLWKWNDDELPGRTPNIKISKWLPQSDLLRHPKVKLFVTQAGLQSTDEAITAGVPLVGIPIFGDQFYNAEHYVYHGIGVKVNLFTLTEEKLNKAIYTVANDKSYRNNIIRLDSIMRDQPQTPLERAVWWTEYVLRHGGAKHLRSAAANVHWTEYYEIKLVSVVLLASLIVILIGLSLLYYIYKTILAVILGKPKLKRT